jgi:hypothetical protein
MLFWPCVALAQSPIVHERVSVAATNDEWTPTPIQVSTGDIVLVLAAGRIRIGQSMGEVGPNGASSGAGALYLKIGVGAGQRVGERAFLIADQSGQVKLRVNDNHYADNAGTFEVSVIQIPAAAIPPAGSTQASSAGPGSGSPYFAIVRSDLRNLVTAQEVFFADSVRYATSLLELHFRPSAGVSLRLEAVTANGWAATATHSAWPGWTCGIFVGLDRPFVPGQREGDPTCWQR